MKPGIVVITPNPKTSGAARPGQRAAVLGERGLPGGEEFGDKFDIVYPSSSILAEPPVAIVGKVVDRKKTRAIAEGYLNVRFSPLVQDIIGKNFYRPRNPEAVAKYVRQFPKIPLATSDETLSGWKKAQAVHFEGGGVFDKNYKPR